MKLSKISILLLVLFACKKNDPTPTQPQLLMNADMEAGSGNPNSWWKSTVGTSYTLTWATEQAKSASHSLKIDASVSDPVNFSFWAQTYQGVIPVGKDLILSVKIKSNLVGSGVSIVIRGDDTSSPSGYAEQFITTQGLTSISGSFDWTAYQVKMTNVQSTIKSITVYFVYLGNTTGSVYFDDAMLTY